MKKRIRTRSLLFGALIAGAAFASGCSSVKAKPDADLDRQVQAQPEANGPEAIATRAAMAFSNAPGLTSDQKAKLMKIYERTYTEASEIRKEIGKNKSLLFELVATTDYKSADVDKLKARVVALDHKRLDIMFKALEDVQGVVGYGKEKNELYRHLRDYEMPGFSPAFSRQ